MKLYEDKEWLQKQYWDKNLPPCQIAILTECASTTIINYMKKYNIQRRTHSESRKNYYKDHTSVRKGKEHSSEAKKKMSLAKKGKPTNHKPDCQCCSCKSKRGEYRGKYNHFYGKHHSLKTKKKLSNIFKGRKCPKISGDNHPCKRPEVRKKISQSRKGMKLSKEHKEAIGRAHKGKILSDETKMRISNSKFDIDFFWEHDCKYTRDSYPYIPSFNRDFKKKVRELYDNKCVITGMTNEEHKKKYGHSLHVHHWMYDKDETNPFYFVPVTNSINLQANFNKAQWIDLFNRIAEEKYCEMLK